MTYYGESKEAQEIRVSLVLKERFTIPDSGQPVKPLHSPMIQLTVPQHASIE
jgi:hypothetical protein